VAVAGCFVVLAAFAVSGTDTPGGVDPRQRKAWWTLGALVVWCFFSDATIDGGIYGGSRWFTYAAAAGVWLGVGMLAGLGTLRPAGFAYLGAMVLCLMTLPAAVDDASWAPCTTGSLEKCSVAGALYRSFASSENYIAILAAFTLVAALTALTGRDRTLIATHALVTLVASGSRTGEISVVATLGVAAVLFLARRRATTRPPGRGLVAAPVVAVSVAAVGAFAVRLILTAPPEALSRRGAIWAAVREPLDRHPVTGVGVSKWAYYQEFGESPLHFFHSGYAMLLFAGGFVGCALFSLWIFWIIAAAARGEHALPVTALAILLALYSVTEVVWNPLAVDGLTWIAMGIASIGSLSRAPARTATRRPVRA
jgi:O-antigen ligase